MPFISSILAFGFLSPGLFAAGAAATSIPIVIHLLNKRKFRIIIWAAMDFLLAAQRRNARRLRFQRWLLLAVRVLALLILAAAVGQMVVNNAWADVFSGGQRAVVVVLDDSYSMGYQRPGTLSPFDASKKLLKDWLGKLSSADKVMLIRASRGGIVPGNRPTPDHAGVEAQLKAMAVSDASTDLAAALEQAADALKNMEQTVRSREVIVLTDFTNSSIHDPVRGISTTVRPLGLEGDRLKKAVEAVKAHATRLRVYDMGAADAVNMAVTELRSERPVIVAGVMTTYDVTVMNATDHEQIDVPLTITLDGVEVHTEKLMKMEAGAPKTVPVKVVVPTPGRHLLEAHLPALDFLGVDDARRLMVDAKQEIPVLLVDGNPGDNRTLGSTQYLQFAYTYPAQGKPGGIFSAKVITELELPTTALQSYAAVVLSDTGAPRSAAVRDNLKKYVEEGGLLMVFPGTHTEAEQMNGLLGDHGAKLLPATLGQLEDVDLGVTFAAEGYRHPVLSIFNVTEDVGFKNVSTTHYLKLGVPTDGSVETVLRYAEADGKPGDAAVVLKQVGKGKVVLFASSADTTWNTFGAKPSFLPFVHELTYYGMSRESGNLTLGVGEKINLPGELENPGLWNGPRGVHVNVAWELDKDGRPRLTSGPLTAAGEYGPEGHMVVAVNPDAEEVDVRQVTAGVMGSTLGVDAKELNAAPKELEAKAALVESGSARGSDLARNLLLAALGLFLLETVLARMFSVYK